MRASIVSCPVLFATLLLAAPACGPAKSDNKNPDDQGGTGSMTPAQLSVNLPTHNFGSVPLGTDSAPVSFLITNTGGKTSGMVTAAITGAGVNDFRVDGKGCDGEIEGGKSCQVRVIFKPTVAGARSATLLVTSPFGGNLMVMLEGAGLVPGSISITPSFKDFGTVVMGQETQEVPFEIVNSGQAMTGPVMIDFTGDGAAQFVITLNTCGPPLAPAKTCTVNVKFRPTAAGNQRATLVAETNPGGKASASVSGLASSLPPGALAVTPTFKDFGTAVVGIDGPEMMFDVKNNGAQATGPVQVEITGDGAAHFLLTQSTCGAAMAPMQGCTVHARYRPTAAGPHRATLQIVGMPGGTVTVTLSGIAIDKPKGATLAFDAQRKEIGGVAIGATGQTLLDVTNLGDTASGPLSVMAFGADSTEFTLVDGCQVQALAPGAVCTLTIGFKPTTTGDKILNVRVAGSPGGTVTATVTGRGLGDAELGVASAFHDFGALVPNTAQFRDVDFAVTNIGGRISGVITATVSAGATDFSIVPALNDCRGRTLTPTGTCTLRLRFLPTSLGEKLGTLAITATPGGTVMMSLSGRGVEQAQLPTGLAYRYFEGQWTTLPNFDALNPVKTGFVDNFTLAPRNRNDHFGFEFTGWIQITAPGQYTFFTSSDDGSRLYINGQLVVDNDGLHAPQERSGNVQLTAGQHQIKVTYFDGTSGESLSVSWQGPGIGKQPIPNAVLLRPSANDTPPGQPPGTPGGSLIGYWKLDEVSGTFAADASGNANNGTVMEAAVPSWQTGRSGNGLVFDGVATWIRVPASASLDQIATTNALTATAWIWRSTMQAGWSQIISRQWQTGGNEHFGLGFAANGRLSAIVNSQDAGTNQCGSATATALNQWVHVAATYDGSTLRVYENGTQVCSLARTVTMKADTSGLVIGGNANNATVDAQEIFNGVIDEVALYSRALTAQEIAQVAAGGALPVQ